MLWNGDGFVVTADVEYSLRHQAASFGHGSRPRALPVIAPARLTEWAGHAPERALPKRLILSGCILAATSGIREA
jgi:hypothetical protein